MQTFFIDHTAKTTTFIDPRLPLEWPILILPALTADATPQTPPVLYAGGYDSVLLTPTASSSQAHLLAPNDPASPLLPPPPPRNLRHSVTPPPTANASGTELKYTLTQMIIINLTTLCIHA